MKTNNVSVFLDKSTINLESENWNLIKNIDKPEILDQLTYIKSKFDSTRKRFSVDDSRMKELERLMNEKKTEEKIGNLRLTLLGQRMVNLTNSINTIKISQEEAQENSQIYSHILERSKKSSIFLEIRANFLKSQINYKRFIVESENRLRYKSRDSRTSSQRAYRTLHSTVLSDAKEKQHLLQRISKDLELREFLIAKREERKKRFLEISEIAANEHRDKGETELREGLMLNRLWSKFLSAKLSVEMQKFSTVELAFQKIRAVTGEYNINELVHKFLTREQTFKELKLTIDSSRKSIERLNKKNLDIEKIINAVIVYDKEARTNDTFSQREGFFRKLKDLETQRTKFKQIKALYEHILEWDKRMQRLFDVKTQENSSIKDMFAGLAKVIVVKVKNFKN